MQTLEQKTVAGYLTDFQEFEKTLNGATALPVHAMRIQAIRQFAESGFPTTRQEEWRFTNVAPIARVAVHPVLRYDAEMVSAEDVKRKLFGGDDAIAVVFVNGFFSPEHSRLDRLPEGVRIESIAQLIQQGRGVVPEELGSLVRPQENAFAALNTAFLRDGAVVITGKGVTVEQPIEILYLHVSRDSAYAIYPRTLVLAGPESRLTILESYAGTGGGTYLCDAVTEMLIGENATVEHDRIQLEDMDAFHIGTTAIRQSRSSTLRSNAISFGGALVRNTITSVLADEGAECTLNGLAVAGSGQLIDNHTTIDHAMPNCTSHELYKSVLGGTAHGVFNGKIYVRPDAQKTDARQTNKTLLLSRDAVMNTKPQLEIFADDVKCTHGATVGQIDEEQLFYLRTRGIGLEDAKNLLTFAFASDVVSRIAVAPLRQQMDHLLRERLERGRTENRL